MEIEKFLKTRSCYKLPLQQDLSQIFNFGGRTRGANNQTIFENDDIFSFVSFNGENAGAFAQAYNLQNVS